MKKGVSGAPCWMAVAKNLGMRKAPTWDASHSSRTGRKWARAARRAPKEAMADDQPRTGGASDLSKMTAICWKVEPLPTPAAGRDWVVVRS